MISPHFSDLGVAIALTRGRLSLRTSVTVAYISRSAYLLFQTGSDLFHYTCPVFLHCFGKFRCMGMNVVVFFTPENYFSWPHPAYQYGILPGDMQNGVTGGIVAGEG